VATEPASTGDSHEGRAISSTPLHFGWDGRSAGARSVLPMFGSGGSPSRSSEIEEEDDRSGPGERDIEEPPKGQSSGSQLPGAVTGGKKRTTYPSAGPMRRSHAMGIGQPGGSSPTASTHKAVVTGPASRGDLYDGPAFPPIPLTPPETVIPRSTGRSGARFTEEIAEPSSQLGERLRVSGRDDRSVMATKAARRSTSSFEDELGLGGRRPGSFVLEEADDPWGRGESDIEEPATKQSSGSRFSSLFKPRTAAGEGSKSRFRFPRGSMWSSRKVDNKGKSPLVPAPGSSGAGSMHETGRTEPPVAGSPATGPAVPKRGSSLGKTGRGERTSYRTDEAVEPYEPPKLPKKPGKLKKKPPEGWAEKRRLMREEKDRAEVQRSGSPRTSASLGSTIRRSLQRMPSPPPGTSRQTASTPPLPAETTGESSVAAPSKKRSFFHRFGNKGDKEERK
jgi:hypothetical protein